MLVIFRTSLENVALAFYINSLNLFVCAFGTRILTKCSYSLLKCIILEQGKFQGKSGKKSWILYCLETCHPAVASQKHFGCAIWARAYKSIFSLIYKLRILLPTDLVSSRDVFRQKWVSDDARCYSVFLLSHDLVYSQNSSLFPKLIIVKTDHPASTNCWSSRGIQGHSPSSFDRQTIRFVIHSFLCREHVTKRKNGSETIKKEKH